MRIDFGSFLQLSDHDQDIEEDLFEYISCYLNNP